MKNFSLRTRGNSRQSFRRPLVVFAVVVVFLCGLVFLGRGMLGGVLAVVTTPLYASATWIADVFSSGPSYFGDRTRLIEEIMRLEEALRAAETRSGVYQALESENEELRDLLGTSTTMRIAAGVLARPPFVPYDMLLIDRGTRDGIQEGAIVYHGGDRAIGVVEQVYTSSALVTLLSTSGIETTVYILGPDIYTTAYGEGNGVIRVSVPQGITITKDDIVILPSLDRGILGEIDTVRSESSEPEQHGFIVSESLQSLRFVVVGTRVQEDVSFEDARRFVEEQRQRALLSVPVPEDVLVDEETAVATTTATTTDEAINEDAIIE